MVPRLMERRCWTSQGSHPAPPALPASHLSDGALPIRSNGFFYLTITKVSAGPLAPAALLRQIVGDGIGRVAVQAVAGVVVPAGRARVFVTGVVLHVPQGSNGVQGEGDRRMTQGVRRQLLLRTDPGGAGQSAHQLPQVALTETPASGGGQQRPRWLPPIPYPGPLGTRPIRSWAPQYR